MKYTIEVSGAECFTIIRALRQFAGDYGHVEVDRVIADDLADEIEREANEEARAYRKERGECLRKST